MIRELSVARHRVALLLGIAAVVALFLLFPATTAVLTDWWWFREIGYQVVFTRELATRSLLFLVVGGVTAGVLYLNLRMAQRGLVPDPLVVQIGPSAPRMDVTRELRRVTLPAALVLGLLAGIGATPAWDLVLRAINRTPFGILDPIFSRDIGFYVFTLPALAAAIGFLAGLAVICLLLLVAVYWLRSDIIVRPPRLVRIERSAGIHLASLVAVLLLLTAVRLWLVDIPSLLYSSTGPLIGASYTDLMARLPALRLSAIVAAVAAIAVLIGGFRGRLVWYGLWAVGGYAVMAILGRGLFPQAMQKFVVAPTELTRETPTSGITSPPRARRGVWTAWRFASWAARRT